MIWSDVQFIRFCHFIINFSFFLSVFYTFSACKITLDLYLTCFLAGFAIKIFLSVIPADKEIFTVTAENNDTFWKSILFFRYLQERVLGQEWSQRCTMRNRIRSGHQRIIPFCLSLNLLLIASLHPGIGLIKYPGVPHSHHKELNKTLLGRFFNGKMMI